MHKLRKTIPPRFIEKDKSRRLKPCNLRPFVLPSAAFPASLMTNMVMSVSSCTYHTADLHNINKNAQLLLNRLTTLQRRISVN